MRALVQAEVLKLRTRTATGLLLATVVMVAIAVSFSVPKAGDHDAPMSLDDPGLLTDLVAISIAFATLLVALLGGLAFTQEFRYGTATSTYLGEPRRNRVLVAKLLTLASAGVVITIATLAVAVPLGIVLIRSRDGDVTLAAQFWQTTAAAFAVMVAYGVIGVAIGVLVRNQIAVAVGVLVWMTVFEHILIPALPSVGRWIPGGATMALLGLERETSLGAELLPAAAAALVLLGYVALAVTLAVVLTPRRDVP